MLNYLSSEPKVGVVFVGNIFAYERIAAKWLNYSYINLMELEGRSALYVITVCYTREIPVCFRGVIRNNSRQNNGKDLIIIRHCQE